MTELIRTDSTNSSFRTLVSLLDEDLKIRDGEEHAFYSAFNKLDKIKHTVVITKRGAPAACGAIKEFDSETVEIKRMFVKPEFRGEGISKLVLNELEKWAKELNYTSCILETGYKQPEAISLYKNSGYLITANYGQYKNVANSVCMKKEIR